MVLKEYNNLYFSLKVAVIFTAAAFCVFLTDDRYDAVAMLKLEFAPTAQKFLEIMQHEGYSNDFVIWCLYVDFVFIAGFSATFFISALLASKRISLKILLLVMSILPGILDLIEDFMMLNLVKDNGMDPYSYRLLAFIEDAKWLLVFPNIAMVLFVMFKRAGRK